MLFLWQIGVVDTFTAATFLHNVSAQYGAMVAAAIADGDFRKIPKALFEPILGLGVGYRFIKAAQNEAERRARVATLAAFLSGSMAAATASTPTANAGLGAGIASHINHMRETLKARGGCSLDSEIVLGSKAKNFEIILDSANIPIVKINRYRYQAEFRSNSKIIINNLFNEHTQRRSFQVTKNTFKTLSPTCIAPIASTQIFNTSFASGTILGFGLGMVIVGCTTFSALIALAGSLPAFADGTPSPTPDGGCPPPSPAPGNGALVPASNGVLPATKEFLGIAACALTIAAKAANKL